MFERGRVAALHARELQRFAQRHPRCAELARTGGRHFLYGVPMHWMNDWGTPNPVFVREASGAQLVCADGHAHADFCLADTAAMFGHSPPALADALGDRLRHGLGAMLPGLDAPAVGHLLAERFGLTQWQVALSASDANRFCIRWARAVTGRPNILVFDGCYHGTVDDVFVDLEAGEGGPDAGPAAGAGAVARTRASLLGQVYDLTAHTRVVEFNDEAGLERALADGSVACVIAEPVMTNVGMVLPQPGFLERLRALCSATGTLLLIDETHTISSGPGGYARGHGIEPDLLVLGKAIAGGVPCAVYGFGNGLAARMRQAKDTAPPGHSGIGTTLAGNLLAMAALRATLAEVATAPAYEHMIAAARRLDAGLRALLAARHVPWSVSRVGARCEFQFCAQAPRNGREARAAMDPELESTIHLYLLNRGVLVTPFHNMMLCCPVTQERDVEQLLGALGACLDELRPDAAAPQGPPGASSPVA
jgi:glutamate-1-semialdehyde 2,1-aminomutase